MASTGPAPAAGVPFSPGKSIRSPGKVNGSTTTTTNATSNNGENRVSVNQRALIDKILSRYSSAHAVYRELLQNSNDANASSAEIYFTTNEGNTVTKAVYRNNGQAFEAEDWSRLQKIAEGNPNPEKVGAFGVGAYSMFSVSEEPTVFSGDQALQFVWKDEQLWTKVVGKNTKDTNWTTFVLPSRDPYQLPNLVEFGQFLCSNMTFTTCLNSCKVFVNKEVRVSISKSCVQQPQPVQSKRSSKWFKFDGATKSTSCFTLGKIFESRHKLTVKINNCESEMLARFVSSQAKTRFTKELTKRIQRVTKKPPPPVVTIQIILPTNIDSNVPKNDAERILHTFSPLHGRGRVFIGFSGTLQTTGLAAHISAPFIPTVEREAMDLQEPALRIYNSQLLQICGIVLRLTLENAMATVGSDFEKRLPELVEQEKQLREERERQIEEKRLARLRKTTSPTKAEKVEKPTTNTPVTTKKTEAPKSVLGFAKFMAQGAQDAVKDVAKLSTDVAKGASNLTKEMSFEISTKLSTISSKITTLVVSTEEVESLLTPLDLRPLCEEEWQAVALMQSFSPQQSTPEVSVGMQLAEGFSACYPKILPPVLTSVGISRGGKLPYVGMEQFFDGSKPSSASGSGRVRVVRYGLYKMAKEYCEVVCQCRKLTTQDMLTSLPVLERDDAARFVRWWVQYSTKFPDNAELTGRSLKETVQFRALPDVKKGSNRRPSLTHSQSSSKNKKEHMSSSSEATSSKHPSTKFETFQSIRYYNTILDSTFPMPTTVLAHDLLQGIGVSTLETLDWFQPIEMDAWRNFIVNHACMTHSRIEDEKLRIAVLKTLCHEWKAQKIQTTKPVKKPENVTNARRSVSAGSKSTTNSDKKSLTSTGKKNSPSAPHTADKKSSATTTITSVPTAPTKSVSVKDLLSNKRCIPFDSSEPSQFAAETPGELYLNSAYLDAFANLPGGTQFKKVSQSVTSAGVTDDFLIYLGVRRYVAIEFLFANLDRLKWSDDPKPMIEYLVQADSIGLTPTDLAKLQISEYLPAENGGQFRPSELHLANGELRLFPFCKLLQWPHASHTAKSKAFLIKIGVRTHPKLLPLLQYISQDVTDQETRLRSLSYVAQNLERQPTGVCGGVYASEYANLRPSTLKSLKLLPCQTRNMLSPSSTLMDEVRSPQHCYSSLSCLAMGFPVVNHDILDASANIPALFRVKAEPDADLVLSQLLYLVARAKEKLSLNATLTTQQKQSLAANGNILTNKHVVEAFDEIFVYLSDRCSQFGVEGLKSLRTQKFIPTIVGNNNLLWFEPSNIYFQRSNNVTDGDGDGDGDGDTHKPVKDNMTELLFHVVGFSPFLSAVGVKWEAATADIFRRMLRDPKYVLNKLKTLGVGSENDESNETLTPPPPQHAGEMKYKQILRQVAADPPILNKQIRDTSFLLACKIQNDEATGIETETYSLARGSDIYLIDNSFFGRMFSGIQRAPEESDLETFYAELGAEYISKKVKKEYRVFGDSKLETEVTLGLNRLLEERKNLLICPNISSRSLVWNAVTLLDANNLEIVEVEDLSAVYTLEDATQKQRITCCCKATSVTSSSTTPKNPNKTTLYVTTQYDWFDVGNAIGGLILQRCQLEDAFFISSLLEAPLDQLRARGFPVDRILNAPPAPAIEPTPQETVELTEEETMLGNLAELYPDKDEGFLRAKLEKQLHEKDNPPSDTPKKSPELVLASEIADRMSNMKVGKLFGKALGELKVGISNVSDDLKTAASSLAPTIPGVGVPTATPPPKAATKEVPIFVPLSSTHTNIEKKLMNAIRTSVPKSANLATDENDLDGVVVIPETVSTPIPEGFKRGNDDSETNPDSLLPNPDPYKSGQTRNGISVLSSTHPSSATFIRNHFLSIDAFATVLQNLCNVYQLDTSQISVYHNPLGGTTAFFHADRLYFNVRFYEALHYRRSVQECYSFWFTIMGRELAHKLVTGHTREHAFYTERYVSMFLPRLVLFLSELE